ncbi:hypothetical protein IAU60_000762 [Kwoniella sp. DSM 27419]
MSAYLDEQTPHLRSLHAQLSLPAEVLQADLARIEAAIRGVITSIIRERESQVDLLKDEIAQAKRDAAGLARAVGDRGREIVAVSRRESFDAETLPNQLKRLTTHMEELKVIYNERLAHIRQQQSTLDSLVALLGHPFQPSQPLQPVATSSKPTLPEEPRKRLSGHTLAQQIASGSKTPCTWYDVGESVSEELDEAVAKALEERDTRRKNLCQTMFNLTWLHDELALPPVPTCSPHNFPPEMLPSHGEEESPGRYASYEKTLHRIIAANPLPPGDCTEWPEADVMEGMEGVEPEVGLIEWADELTELWNARKEEHEARIQELYNLVEPLWARLEVDQQTTDLFVEMNRGSGGATIKAYEEEYERLLEIRRASLSSFIENVRKEIDALQTELMMSDEERGEFGPYIDDDYSEELLHLHEVEIERLREEVELKASILPKVREWHALVRDEEELERTANDPNRFKMRGGAMLREEKLRKRVGILKPKIENDLLTSLPVWEEEHGRPFLVSGERVIAKIQDEREAKEAAKEAKKRAKQGLAPSKTLPPRQTPGPAPRTVSGSTISRPSKREAPTPTPLVSYQAKRARVPPSTGASMAPMTSASSVFGGSSIRPMSKTHTGRSVSASHYGRSGAASPTPFGAGKSRAMSHSSGTMFPMVSAVAKSASGVTDLGKADGRRPRRESFKPRSSVLPLTVQVGGGMIDWGVVEEDEDVF